MKQLLIECTECQHSYETDDSSKDFDEWIEKVDCPNCKKLIGDKK